MQITEVHLDTPFQGEVLVVRHLTTTIPGVGLVVFTRSGHPALVHFLTQVEALPLLLVAERVVVDALAQKLQIDLLDVSRYKIAVSDCGRAKTPG